MLEDKIKKIMSKLTINGFDNFNASFSNGKGYIQHNVNTVNEVTCEIIQLAYCNGNYGNDVDKLKKTLARVPLKGFRQNSIVGRYLDSTPFWSSYSRLVCIDYKGREFGQAYFAINPERAVLECLNKHFRKETIDKLFKN